MDIFTPHPDCKYRVIWQPIGKKHRCEKLLRSKDEMDALCLRLLQEHEQRKQRIELPISVEHLDKQEWASLWSEGE
jgi:hypothetical protein